MNTQKVRLKLVALRLDRKSVLQVIADAQHYVLCMTGNPYFPSPEPSLSSVALLTDQLEAAQQAALSRAKGLVTQRDVIRKKLELMLTTLGGYVESTANHTGDPDIASVIIASSGMEERKFTPRTAKAFKAEQGPVSGSVALCCPARRRSVFFYEMSETPYIPESWVRIYTGFKVKFIQRGLIPGTQTFFRMAELARGVMGEFGDPVGLMVV